MNAEPRSSRAGAAERSRTLQAKASHAGLRRRRAATRAGAPRLLLDDFVQSPFVRQALQSIQASVGEAQAGAGDEVLHRLRDEHAARGRQRGNARGSVQGNSVQLAVPDLALAGVEADPVGDPERAERPHDRRGALDRAGRAVERRQKSIACGVDLLAAIPRQLTSHRCMVDLQEVGKAQIALSTAISVEPTMSVNIRVETRLSADAGVELPVRKLWMW